MSVTPISTRTQTDADLAGYVHEFGDLPPSILLGRVVIWTIADQAVSHSELSQWFGELGLDPKFLPSKPNDLDAFKKAMSAVNQKSYPLTDGKQAIYLSRSVANLPDLVTYQITREVKDQRNRRLSYEMAIEGKFYRPKKTQSAHVRLQINKLVVTPGTPEHKHLQALAGEITGEFKRYRDFLDGQAFRRMIRSYLQHLNAVELKPSVYFVHAEHDQELGALAELVRRIGGGCELSTIPLPNTDKQKEFVTRAFEREAEEQLSRLARDAKDAILKSKRGEKKLTITAAAKLKRDYDKVLERAQEHMNHLQFTQDLTASAAEVALKEIERAIGAAA